MIKYIIIIIQFCIFAQTVLAQPARVLKSTLLQNASYSVYAIDAENGTIIYETAQKSLVPASVMKVSTTW